MSGQTLLIWIVVGLIAGWLASAVVGGGLAACAFGAIVYDICHWFAAW